MLKTLPFGDRQDYEDARWGFIGTMPEVLIKGDSGMVIWNVKEFDFLKQPEAPATVNPSLWQQAHLTCQNGLFKVTGSMYQLRGFLATSSQ